MAPAKLAVIGLCALLAAPPGAAGLLAPPDAQTIPSASEALAPQAVLWDAGELIVGIEAAPGCYLYRDKLRVEVLEPAGYRLGAPMLPAGELHRDEHFGEVRILRGSVQARYRPAATVPPRRVRLSYQGCADKLVCYPPQSREFDVLSVSP